jgi:hypothetical protein
MIFRPVWLLTTEDVGLTLSKTYGTIAMRVYAQLPRYFDPSALP